MIRKTDGYRRLDFSKIAFADETVTMDDALKNVPSAEPISKIEITKVKKDYDNKCVKLEISY